MKGVAALLALLLTAAAGAVGQKAAATQTLLPAYTYTLQDGEESLVVARSVWLGGTSVGNSSGLASAQACIKACGQAPECDWVNWCPLRVRAAGGSSLPKGRLAPPLRRGGCRLAPYNSTTAPSVCMPMLTAMPAGRSASHRTAATTASDPWLTKSAAC